jgi:hypothetical protein
MVKLEMVVDGLPDFETDHRADAEMARANLCYSTTPLR